MGAPVSVTPLEAALMQRVLAHVAARQVPRPPGRVIIELHPTGPTLGDAGEEAAAEVEAAADGRATSSGALAAMAELAAQRARVEARMVVVAEDVVAATGAALLADKGFTSVEELSATARRKWRAEAKATAVAELQLLLGLGVMAARRLVGLASATVATRATVVAALERGEVSLDMALRFWERCGRLTHDDGADVAQALFGTDPATAAVERLGPDGDLLSRPWHVGEYEDALRREALCREGNDAAARREERRRARAERDATMRAHDDGTATLTVSCPLTTGAAIYQRIDRASRSLRGAGDPRTLAQLRADIASALLLHGVLPLPDRPERLEGQPQDLAPGAGEDAGRDGGGQGELGGGGQGELDLSTDDLVSPADLAEIARILSAIPPVQLQVVIPWDMLTGRPAGAAFCPAPCCTSRPDGSGSTPGPSAGPPGPSAGPPDPSADPRVPDGDPPEHLASRGAGRGGVGQILDLPGGYITPEHARVLAMAPSTTLARLLTDPADGRLIERSITSYRPDADMRRQVRAADVTSRAPGSRRPAAGCDLDHEHPWADGGPTSEANLNCKDRRSHGFKTKGWWTTTMAPNRDVSWTTLLGQTETTRSHDYRQYLDARAPSDPDEAGLHPALRTDHDDRLDLAGQALYAALVHRGPHAHLADPDDAHGATDHDPSLGGWIWVSHTNPDGVRRHGPPPDHPRVHDILGIPTDPGPDTPWARRTAEDEPPPF